MMTPYTTIAMAPPPGGPAEQQSPLYFPMMMVLMFAIIYFVMYRPQRQREKQRQEMLKQVKSGDRVLFGGGIIGSVTNVKEKTIVVKVADKVKLEVLRGAVTQVLQKDELPTDAEPETAGKA
jgi:preprotein translocase subunit YajC